MEAVDIFLRRDRQQHLLGVDLRGQRQLHQDAVDLVAPVQIVDQGQQLVGGDVVGRRVLLAVDTELLAALHLVANVDLRGRIVSGEHDRQSRPKSRGSQLL